MSNNNSNPASSSQTSRLKAYLEAGNSITQDSAISLLGCVRLAARIQNLKQMGMNIVKTMVGVPGSPRPVASYSLDMTNPTATYCPKQYKSGSDIQEGAPMNDMNHKVYERLMAGEHLTNLGAYRDFQCRRLATRVFYLKRAYGLDIRSKTMALPNGKRVTEYFIGE